MKTFSTVGHTGIHACGDCVRRYSLRSNTAVVVEAGIPLLLSVSVGGGRMSNDDGDSIPLDIRLRDILENMKPMI